jgi:hypothetical protein
MVRNLSRDHLSAGASDDGPLIVGNLEGYGIAKIEMRKDVLLYHVTQGLSRFQAVHRIA